MWSVPKWTEVLLVVVASIMFNMILGTYIFSRLGSCSFSVVLLLFPFRTLLESSVSFLLKKVVTRFCRLNYSHASLER
jgi:hypothetical protein